MKKALILFLLCAIMLSACNSEGGNAPSQTPDSDVPETTEPTENVAVYDENTPLFVCRDRSDIEGDRNTFYFYNYKGDMLDADAFSHAGYYGNSDLAPAVSPTTGKRGFVDRDGIFVIDAQYDDAFSFSDDGIALVAVRVASETGEYTETKYGYINTKGEQIVPCTYGLATSFYNCGLAIVGGYVKIGDGEDYRSVKQLGVIDKTGRVIVEPQFTEIAHITEDYIFCTSEEKYVIYDLSGNLLDECVRHIDETHYYYCMFAQGKLYRYIREILPKTTEGEPTSFKIKEQKVFDGKAFVDKSYDLTKPYIRYEEVSTTSTGRGYGVWAPGEKRGDEGTILIPYKYDQLIQYGSYYVGIRYRNGDQNDHILDIYNKDFEKTAENLEYSFVFTRADSFGNNIALPDGYFQVSVYDNNIQEMLNGIIDPTGEFVVPLLFYRPIQLFTYEGVGGNFTLY